MHEVIWYILIIMKNISETDGLSREKRLEKVSSPIVLPVLEEHFSQLLALALRHSDLTSIYQYQSLIILLDIEQFDSYTWENELLNKKEKDSLAIEKIFGLVFRINHWHEQLLYACMNREPNLLLADLSGQIENMSPVLFNFRNTCVDDKKPLTQLDYFARFPLASIRFLQSKIDKYREDIYSSGRMDPSLAVIVAFLKNYKEIVSHFNDRWKSLPTFYLKKILKVSSEGKKNGTAWFSFEKSSAYDKIIVPRNTCLKVESDGIANGYKLLSDINLTMMKVGKIKMVLARKDKVRYPEVELNHITSISMRSFPDTEYKPTPIGICIHSSMFYLNEGVRQVDILFKLTKESLVALDDVILQIVEKEKISYREAQYKILNDAFCLYASTAEGERPVQYYRFRLEQEVGLLLTFKVVEDFPAIVPFGGEDYPGLRLLINPLSWLYSYTWASAIKVQAIRIHTMVTGIRNIQIYNEMGEVDIQQPFAPWGNAATMGSFMCFGNYEIASKPTKSVTFTFDWQNLPFCDGGMKEYYQDYSDEIDNTSFKMNVEQLVNRSWKAVSGSEPIYMFRTSSHSVPLKEGALIPHTEIQIFPDKETIIPFGQKDQFRLGISYSGFYRFVFSSPDMGFGEKSYRFLFAQIMMTNSRLKHPKPLPNPPVSLLMNTPILSYEAEQEYCFNIGSAPSIRVSYICPLTREGMNSTPDYNKPISFVDGPQNPTNLLIGISGAIGESLIRMYIEVEHLQREIDHNYLPDTTWHYQGEAGWKQIEPINVLCDNTGGMMHSGAVTLQLPCNITSGMTDADGLFWICLTVHNNSTNCSEVRNVYLNVAEAEALDEPQIENAIPGLSGYYQITPLQGTRQEENNLEMRVRISERIAHRQRLLLPHEYEEMALQKFPELDKVKFIKQERLEKKDRKNVVKLAIVHHRSFDDYPLCTDELLCKVEQVLQLYASPFVSIDAINPVYEDVTVFCGLKLKGGINTGEAIQEITDNIRTCIAPWDKKREVPVFGYFFSLDDLAACIKDCNGVDIIHGVKLIHRIHKPDKKYILHDYVYKEGEIQKISSSVPWGILVPAFHQYIKVMSDEEWRGIVEIGDFEIENTFVIE